MMAARAATLLDRSDGAVRRMRRPGILLLILLVHGALLLLASRWQTRLDLRTEGSLIFLTLPSHVQATTETPTARVAPREKPAPTREIQLIVVPKEVAPAPPIETASAAIDWNAEAALTAKQQAQSAATPGPRALDQRSEGLYFDVGPGPEPGIKPEFGWSHSRTRRIEALEGGGSILWLNDRCFIVMAGVIPFPLCGIGKIPPRADLFDHMHDAPAPDHPNTVP